MKKKLLITFSFCAMFYIVQAQTTSSSNKTTEANVVGTAPILKNAPDSAAMMAKNIEEGQKFLLANKSKPGIKVTSTGLQYEVIKEGSGTKPTLADSAVAHFVAKYIDGNEFNNSYEGEEPVTFPVKKMIKGWVEGLQLMTPGSKYIFYIPNELAYGKVAKPQIPAGSALIDEIELIEVKKE